ncbi:MAG: T9SS type A sorting domain-containing protein [Bacteroidota bacterium]
MRGLTAFLLLALAASVSGAQGYPYRPVDLGNEWVYTETYESSDGDCTSCGHVGYVRLHVSRDTTWEGALARVVECSVFEPNGQVVAGVSEFVALVDFGIGNGSQQCSRFLSHAAPNRTVSESDTLVTIGGLNYAVPSKGRYLFDHQSTGGSGFTREDWLAEGIGVFSSTTWSRYHHADGGGHSTSTWTLEYARIGGRLYGTSPVPVAAEQRPTPAPLLRLRVYPNPARRDVLIETGQPVVVSIYDALGRRVAVGPATPSVPLRLDVSTWSPGLYIARASGPSGTASVQVVVAR